MTTGIIKINPDNFKGEELEEACHILKDGGLVAFPTETVYGLGGDALNPLAASKIYGAKGRPSDNPLIVHIACIDSLYDIAEVTEDGLKLAKAFWPGPLTMIFHKLPGVPYETTGGLDTVAVRMPEHPGALAFLERAGVPVAAPSANRSGRPSPTQMIHVREDLDGKIDMIIDGGAVGIGLESTIVDMTENVPVILRPGAVTKQMIAEVTGEVIFDPAIMSAAGDRKPKAPGMKYRHYAPRAKMIVFRGDVAKVTDRINRELREYCCNGGYRPEEIGILAAEETADGYSVGQVVTAGSRRKGTVGKYIYGALRKFDELSVRLILAESFYGLAQEEAIMNRLLKAAGQCVVDV